MLPHLAETTESGFELGFGNLVVNMLASGTQDCGFTPS
jgi:hypothetical protein